MNDNIMAYRSRFGGFIQQLPNELFFQITNLDSDIAFAGNLKAELIDLCQNTVLDITNTFFYDEFTDIKGIKQIAFEFGNIGIDYHQEPLVLKLSHTVSDKAWYSTCFLVTNYLKEETTRFDYKNEAYFKGISYDRANYFQSIRLQCLKNDSDVNAESNEYTQLSGNIISQRNILTNVNKYKFYVCDFFTFYRLVILLNHDIIYIDSYRISNKPQTSKGERIEDANIFELSFDSNPTEEFKIFGTQLNIIIPYCGLLVSGLSASLTAGTMTATWSNSATTYNAIVEISTNGGLTWVIPSGLVLGMIKNSATYNDPLVSHSVRITPKCTIDSFGLPSVASYVSVTIPSPVNCVVSAWSAWSDCVNGSQSRTRTVITPASNGGTACPILNETQSCTVGSPATLYSYKRDGSQNGSGFHLPYINYTDELGNPAVFYADENLDICGSFRALSITSIHYCTLC